MFSLVPQSERVPLPEQLSIDTTGLLAVSAGIPVGTHSFYIQATNGIEPDARQAFTLTVTAPSIRGISILGNARGDLSPAGEKPLPNYLSAGASPVAQADRAFPLFSYGDRAQARAQVYSLATGGGSTTTIPPSASAFASQNTFVLRNDDPADLYDSDMEWVQGAEYIKWDGILTLTLEGQPIRMAFLDGSPSADHHQRGISPEQLEKLKDYYKQEGALSVAWGAGLLGEAGLDGWVIPIDPLDQNNGSTILDYSQVWNALKAGEQSDLHLQLGMEKGTLVPGTLFADLAGKEGTSLSLEQPGATIAFTGLDVAQHLSSALFDFAYSMEAPHKAGILQAAGLPADAGVQAQSGPDVEQAFTFAFAHNGALPGYGSFGIETGMPEGTIVQVYRFDERTGGLTLIGENLAADGNGVVTYLNNTTSEYLITTRKLEGIPRSEAADMQRTRNGANQNELSPWVLYGGIGLVVLGIVGVVVFLRRGKNRKINKTL